MVNYFLRSSETDNIIAEADVAVINYKKAQDSNAVNIDQLGWTNALRGSLIFDDCQL